MPYLLAGDSVVFKMDSEYYEHFYKELEPWVHYIPFKKDLSDLQKNLDWAIANDKEVGQSLALYFDLAFIVNVLLVHFGFLFRRKRLVFKVENTSATG